MTPTLSWAITHSLATPPESRAQNQQSIIRWHRRQGFPLNQTTRGIARLARQHLDEYDRLYALYRRNDDARRGCLAARHRASYQALAVELVARTFGGGA